MLRIGTLKLKSNLILAPMAGVSDLPFRLLNRRFGCELGFIEMINVRSLSYKMRKTKKMLSTNVKDRPLGIQIIGCEEEFILRGIDVLGSCEYDILDFNAACPVKKVARRGEGAALLKDPKKLHKLLKLIVNNSKKPVTVKIRTGWDKNSINAKETALASQDAGVSALFIHGRNREQGYSGEVDYDTIKDVKRALDIPVIGSGDVFSPELAKKMLDETGCDGLLIARGALGNPWVFKEIKEFLKNEKTIKKPGIDKIADVMIDHMNSYIDFYDALHGIRRFHKFFAWYTKGVPDVRTLREKAFRTKTKEGMLEIIQSFRKLTNV
ncbi:MAG: tRNA dihydrouridine synthase DusB [Omnitrophica bacterium GWA2_41_15]|nr:MAG: tRNA dihydrouridine synthase DusB [Omnitrophica bacterium GWA2_41_15]HAZ10548.1 tRNA dihydrouridine synthase DusB [Candidatus Omnitrophota bacterium]